MYWWITDGVITLYHSSGIWILYKVFAWILYYFNAATGYQIPRNHRKAIVTGAFLLAFVTLQFVLNPWFMEEMFPIVYEIRDLIGK